MTMRKRKIEVDVPLQLRSIDALLDLLDNKLTSMDDGADRSEVVAMEEAKRALRSAMHEQERATA